LTIAPSAIAQHASLSGSNPILVNADVILHPHAKINSANGKVLLGEGVVMAEKAMIGVQG
jgi:dynactin-6